MHKLSAVLGIAEQRTNIDTVTGGDWNSFHIARCKCTGVGCTGCVYRERKTCVIFILVGMNNRGADAYVSGP